MFTIRLLYAPALLILIECVAAKLSSLTIGSRKFPDDFCSADQISQMLDSLINLRELPIEASAHLTRFLPDICLLNHLFNERVRGVYELQNQSSWHQDFHGLLSVYSQHAEMRQFCMLTPKSGAKLARDYQVWNWKPSEINCKNERGGKLLAWEPLRLYKMQTCILIYLMCFVCYAYGRLMSLKLSPSVRLRRLNWTKENFIWAYKNF